MTRLDDIPRLPRDGDGEPVFEAPWQAQAFAMTLALYERGFFTWSEWSDLLADQLSATDYQHGNDGYYRAWLAALEKLACGKKLSSSDELATRQAEWDKAAKNTPHGEPIELFRDS